MLVIVQEDIMKKKMMQMQQKALLTNMALSLSFVFILHPGL
jgi:hypothetical protein